MNREAFLEEIRDLATTLHTQVEEQSVLEPDFAIIAELAQQLLDEIDSISGD